MPNLPDDPKLYEHPGGLPAMRISQVSGGGADPVGLKNVGGTQINPATEDGNLATIAGDTTSIDGKITTVDTSNVTIGSPLPSGTNNIGDVDIASALPPGTNNIGDVDVLTLPDVTQATHDNLNSNANIQVGDTDVSGANPVPISASALPLPPDAATASNQLPDGHNVAVNAPLPAGTNNIGDVDVASMPDVTQSAHDNLNANANIQVGDTDVSGANPVPISAGTLPLPTGAATAANQLPDGHNVAINAALPSGTNNIGDVDVLTMPEVTQATHDNLNMNANIQQNNSDVSASNGLFTRASDSPSIDAFARWRVSNPQTIFDSKQLYDSQPLFWDDAETSGSGTNSSHSVNRASTSMSVSNVTAGTRVRQTKQRFNYQPGKSQLILMTGVITSGNAGVTRRMGYFDENNGLFLEVDDTTINLVRRSFVTGSAVDTATAQASWNIDTMDGNGASGINLNFNNTQIFVIDFEWLGVGRVRFGFVIDGLIFYCHELLNANVLTAVYMSTPNLPLRYEISNDGTGPAVSIEHICTTVISEGGQQETGIVRSFDTGSTHVDADTAGTIYAIVGIRLKTTHISASIVLKNISLISETTDDFRWLLCLNPTIAGTFTYSDLSNSAIQGATGATANTVSDVGTLLASGYASVTSQSANETLDTALKLGSLIDGTRDEILLACMPLSSNADIHGSLVWRELS